ncbi:MAG: tetratricopeptide repeat protein [Gammaproteobacteria bacterium]
MALAKRVWRILAIGTLMPLFSLAALLIVMQGIEPTVDRESNRGRTRVAPEAECPMAMIEHRGSTAIDRRISGFQKRLRSDFRPEYLEALAWSYVAKARSAFDPGFYSLAEAAAQCIDKAGRGSPSALLLFAHIHHNLHQFRRAETEGRRLVAERGAWFDYAVFGDALMEQGKLDQAAAAYQAMMAIRPGPEAYLRAAHLRWLTGDLDGAIELQRMAIPSAATLDQEGAAWAHVRLGNYLLQGGESELSRAYLQKALEIEPDYPPALLALGRIDLAEDRPHEALARLLKAAERNPLPEYQWVLIEALQSAGDESRVQSRMDLIRRRGPVEDPRTYTLFRADTGAVEPELLALAERELEVRRDVFTLDAMAWLLYALGDYGKALEFSAEAMQTGTRDARLFLHRGAIAAANSRFAEAHHWLSQADELRRMLLPSERKRLVHELEALPETGAGSLVRPAKST